MRTLGSADEVLEQMWRLATFDANQLSQYRRGSCRYCWGFGHQYQWRDAVEFEEKLAEALAKKGKEPNDRGGYGYDHTSSPNPKCPRCNGDGIGQPFFADTRKLAPDAALAYSGVKLGKNGVEITAISRERMYEAVMKRLGLADSEFAQRLQQIEIERRQLEIDKLRKELAADPEDDEPTPVAININVVDARVRKRMAIAPTLNVPQARFLAMQQKFKAYVAGFGSGKTWVGCGGICKGFWEFPKINQGYFAPTYPQIRDIFYPTVEEVAHDWGLKVKIVESNKEVHFYSGRQYRGTTICRSMEKPDTIVGFKIGNALVDELDVLKADKARQAWRKIIARMRYKVDGLRNGIDVTTTPEGFKFVYNQFVKAVREKPGLRSMYGLVQASTFDNEKNLPDDYIPSLLASYPPELIKAYLNGQFTNLTSGTIYHQFDRVLNNSSEEEQPGEALYIGMDFNVGKMAGIVHVLRLGLPHAVTEIINAYDTPDMIRIIKERFWLYADGDYRKVREIYIYPDASGDSRKSNNASKTDIEQLRQAGFNVIVDDANPPVKDRINSMNAMFCNGNGDRRYKVNVARCPVYADCLEQQVWDKNGEPDKKSDNDHPNDGAGYFIVKQFPIFRPAFSISLDTTF